MRTANIYNFLIEANIMASIAILLLMVLRKAARKPLGNGALCFGWLLVAVRLVLPFSIESRLSLQPEMPQFSDTVTQQPVRPPVQIPSDRPVVPPVTSPAGSRKNLT